jgi:hypothetical protein
MAILDHRGNSIALVAQPSKRSAALADKPDERPEKREILVASVRDKYSSYPSRGLTPQRLATIFREADGGNITRQAELFNEMEEKSTHIFSVFKTRKLAVVKNEMEILPASDRHGDLEIAQSVRANIAALPDFTQDLTDMLDAIDRGSGVEVSAAIHIRLVGRGEQATHPHRRGVDPGHRDSAEQVRDPSVPGSVGRAVATGASQDVRMDVPLRELCCQRLGGVRGDLWHAVAPREIQTRH